MRLFPVTLVTEASAMLRTALTECSGGAVPDWGATGGGTNPAPGEEPGPPAASR